MMTKFVVFLFSLVSLHIAVCLRGILAKTEAPQISWLVAGFFLAGIAGLIWIGTCVYRSYKEWRESTAF
jgi:hypothetical protein